MEQQEKLILAILSPSIKAYSETFIQAHRDIPGVEVKFYHEGSCPAKLDEKDLLTENTLLERILSKIKKKFFEAENFSRNEIALLASFKKEKVSCVLAEYGPTGAMVYKICRKSNLPLIIHFHGYDASVFDIIERFKEKYLEMFTFASFIVAVSKVMVEKLINLGCPAEKIIYNPYGPNDAFFELVPEYQERNLVGVGRFVDKKAPYYTILAFSKVANEFPDAKLILAGDGILLNTCSNLVKYLKLEKQVVLPGAISPEELRNYYKKARAFVQHSITALNGDMEGTPLAVLEAGAAALPVISTRHAGISDIIIEGKTGLLVDEHDVNGMAEKMKLVLENKDFAINLGLSARKHIGENFNLDKHLKKLNELIMKSVKANFN